LKRVRVIPVLLLKNGGLYKSSKFRDFRYVGDPINAVKIFNEKEVDEIILLDIDATSQGRTPDFNFIREIASEAFMPLGFGGGISTVDMMRSVLRSGAEKVVINNAAINNPQVICEAAKEFGSQSVVVSIDVKKDWRGKYKVYALNGKVNTGKDPGDFSKAMQDIGAGEIFINSIDRDGTYGGYDLILVETVSKHLDIPVVVCGGASSIKDFELATKAGASAVAAGSMFVFQRPHNAVLISYPEQSILHQKLYSQIK
jgi:imidazole glycerol-phosphate synthase subunit HisF